MKSFWGLSKVEVFFIAFAILGVTYILSNIIYSNFDLKNNKRYTTGKVVDSYVSDGIWYKYEYYVDNVRYEGERTKDGRVKVNIGDNFSVKYSSNNPYNHSMIFHKDDD